METANTVEEDDASRPTNIKRGVKSEANASMDKTDGGSKEKKRYMYAKQAMKYKPQWEKIEAFADWLQRTPENLVMAGKPAAYCVFCQQSLRAHKSDLMAHAKSKKHKEAENNTTTPRDCRSFIESYVPDHDDTIEDTTNEPTKEGSSDPPNRRSRGRSSKPIANKAAIIEQITVEMEDTYEKIRVCEEELNSLRIKKARLEFEYEYYDNH